MKQILGNKYLIIGLLLIVVISYFLPSMDGEYNSYKCETKKIKIEAMIDSIVSTRSNYMQVHVNNIEKSFSLNPAKVIYRHGFNEFHFFAVGDSIIKKAGSKEVKVKNKDNVLVFILDCDD